VKYAYHYNIILQAAFSVRLTKEECATATVKATFIYCPFLGQ